MNLIPNWRVVLRHAWSIRLLAIAGGLSFLEVLLPLIGARLPFPPLITALLIAASSAGAFVARFVAQRQITPPDPLDQHYEDLR